MDRQIFISGGFYCWNSEVGSKTLGIPERAQTRTIESRAVKVEASRNSAERLALIVPGRHEPVPPTHWSFGQLVLID